MLSIGTIAAKVFGTSNDRKLKSYNTLPEQVNALEAEVEALSDEQLRERTETYRKQLENDEVTLDDLIAPAFATVRDQIIKATMILPRKSAKRAAGAG